MKGVVFNLLEEAVVAGPGPDAWEDLIAAAQVNGAYTSLGSYPDEEIFALVDAAATLMQTDATHVLRWFGRAAIPLLAVRYPEFFAGHRDARSFVLSVNDIIHPEVRKLYSGAGCPHFHFADDPAGRLVMGYQSPRQLCQLAHGFVLGASDHFAQEAELEHLQCMAHGEAVCRIAVRWLP
jgi:hypothetical protein